jgi:glutamate formiminotransferase
MHKLLKVCHQQYTISAANKLADFLSDKQYANANVRCWFWQTETGQGQGMQLPDIIKKQEGLGEKMKDGMKKGDKGEGQKGQNGKQGKTGQSGQEGEVVGMHKLFGNI